ncbi:hypothetical protein KOI35_33750 [Actinoplanes bogorensis]|uniref:Uncharacterized protein n=1 Tax=Paractinoplanes bogorensis TaxID=1610840 RepID=A0ABS5YYH2_9ACTN|nr:hypothetical protein [Actinoplanes bogorensis]MBU2668489.1 hypothetical protein [Actinoplanes bogorensis]
MGLSRAEVTEGVDVRLETTLHAYEGMVLIPIPPALLKAPPTHAGVRILRGGRVTGLGDAYEATRHVWEGCRIEGAGRTLVVHDPYGYVITLTQQPGDDPILTVASPPIPARLIDPPLLAGLLSGLALGCIGPCFAMGPMRLFPSAAFFWAWVPLYLLIGGGAVWRPETRRFGLGFLASGALVGITVAWFFS